MEPCELLPGEEARELGILAEEESGRQQTDSNCYFNNRADISVDVRVSEGTSTDRTVVWHTLAGAFDESGLEEYTEVSGYPGSTTANDDGTACNLDVATSDEHKFTLQVTASGKNACEVAVPVAESVVAHTPEL